MLVVLGQSAQKSGYGHDTPDIHVVVVLQTIEFMSIPMPLKDYGEKATGLALLILHKFDFSAVAISDEAKALGEALRGDYHDAFAAVCSLCMEGAKASANMR